MSSIFNFFNLCKLRGRISNLIISQVIIFLIILVYNLDNSKRKYNITKYKGLPTANSEPKFVLLLTQIRSGSRITAKILTRTWNSFLTEEPLVEYSRNKSKVVDPMTVKRFIKDLFMCNFTNWPDYYRERMTVPYFHHNLETLAIVKEYPSLKLDSRLDNYLCSTSRNRIMKTVTLDAEIAYDLLQEGFKVKIVHLIRDPHAVVNSRNNLKLQFNFNKHPCDRLATDLHWIHRMKKDFLESFYLLRYEDFVSDPLRTTKKLFQFLDLPYSARIAAFIETNTQRIVPVFNGAHGPFSITRTKGYDPFSWRKNLNFSKIIQEQSSCEEVLRFYNYTIHKN